MEIVVAYLKELACPKEVQLHIGTLETLQIPPGFLLDPMIRRISGRTVEEIRTTFENLKNGR